MMFVAMYFCSQAYSSFSPQGHNSPFSVFHFTDKVQQNSNVENTDINRSSFQIITSFLKQPSPPRTNPPRYI